MLRVIRASNAALETNIQNKRNALTRRRVGAHETESITKVVDFCIRNLSFRLEIGSGRTVSFWNQLAEYSPGRYPAA